MQDSQRPNRHQRHFLARLKRHPQGLATSEWPNPATLRRWLRHDGFIRAIASLQHAMQVHADLQLMSAATLASGAISSLLTPNPQSDPQAQGSTLGSSPHTALHLRSLTQLLRVVHWRLKELDHRLYRLRELEPHNPNWHPKYGCIHPAHWDNPKLIEDSLRQLGATDKDIREMNRGR